MLFAVRQQLPRRLGGSWEHSSRNQHSRPPPRNPLLASRGVTRGGDAVGWMESADTGPGDTDLGLKWHNPGVFPAPWGQAEAADDSSPAGLKRVLHPPEQPQGSKGFADRRAGGGGGTLWGIWGNLGESEGAQALLRVSQVPL